MNKIKPIVCFFLTMLGISGTFRTADAVSTPPDPARTCSLTVGLIPESTEDPPAAGTQTVLYYVADADLTDSTPQYTYSEAFADCGIVLADITDKDTASQLRTYAVEKALEGAEQTADATGRLAYTDLKQGLYLMTASSVPDGFTEFAPYLICLPQTDDSGWIYDAAAAPKMLYVGSDESRLRVQKIWANDAGQNRPNEVTVRLMNDDGVYDTVTLNAQTDWKYTWSALPARDDWYVQEVRIPAGYTVSYTQEGVLFTVKNTWTPKPPDDRLVQTGQLNWPVPLLAAGGLLLILSGAALKKHGRNRVHEDEM